MAYGNTFMRCEMKFILSAEQYAAVRAATAPFVTEETFGKHTICNIYCDNDNNDLIRTSLDKPIYKEKLRLRSYGTATDNSAAFLEIKKKFDGVVYKRRVQLPYKAAQEYLEYGTDTGIHSQQLSEIDYMIKRLSLKPKLVICYDRRAFYGNEDREFRLTFDSNIRSRTTDLDLRLGDSGELLLGQPFRVMEIKVAHSMPLWMTHILSEFKIYQCSFSKYGSIYKASIAQNNNRGIEQCSQVS